MIRLLTLDIDGNLALESFQDDSKAPKYAILSHTWCIPNSDEPTFQDIVDKTGQDKPGLKKVRFCLEKAKAYGLRYCWVDTCCIDKRSSAELSTAINSMYRWYYDAAVCFVYLADVSALACHDGQTPFQPTWEPAFRQSRWWSRGWTLQELLAPRHLAFFSLEGTLLGDKSSLESIVHEITDIPVDALRGSCASYDNYERRKWVGLRTTSQPEDMVHCLLGILNISMPPCYGEGLERATFRLERELQQSATGTPNGILGKRMRPELADEYELEQVTRHRSGPATSIDNERIAQLIESLKFDQIEARHLTITKAWSKTCRWLLKDHRYLEWQDDVAYENHHGFLWIKGKPGSGKSTIMKFAVAEARKKMKGSTLLFFFFNARGEHLEKSTIGAYRTLLIQLLEQIPGLQSVFEILGPAASRIGPDYNWNVETLKDLLDEAFQRLQKQPVVCYIDALDECDDEEIRSMISFFEDVGERALESGNRLRICLASRHYPHITPKWGLSLTLEGTEGHTQDIQSFLASELNIGRSQLAEKIRTDLFNKASGVFMWIVLVVTILNKEYDKGSIHSLQRRLAEIPADLHALFEDILTRDSVNKAAMLVCVQWVLFARQPLNPEQLFHAIRLGTEGILPDPNFAEQFDEEAVRRFILNASKGLAEQTRSSKATVQFIHESVRDFLLKEGGLAKIWPDGGRDVVSLSHARLQESCKQVYDGVKFDGIWEEDRGLDKLPKPSSSEGKELRAKLCKRYPLIDYATPNMLYHAEKAAEGGLPQSGILELFRTGFELWMKTANILETTQKYRFKDSQVPMYILAQQYCPNLLQQYWQHLGDDHSELERENVLHKAIFCAFDANQYDATKILLSVKEGFSMRSAGNWHVPFVKGICKTRAKVSGLLLKSGYLDGADHELGADLLANFVRLKMPEEVMTLLKRGANPRQVRLRSAPLLHVACKEKWLEIVEILLQRGVDVHEIDGNLGCTALHSVCAGRTAGAREIMQLLLANGFNAHRGQADGKSALHVLCDNPEMLDAELANLLISIGAGLDQQDAWGRTTLHTFAYYSSKHGRQVSRERTKLLEILLANTVDVDARDMGGQTALLALCQNRGIPSEDRAVFGRKMIESGANVNARDKSGETALFAACRQGRVDMVRLLLDHGAKVNFRSGSGMTALNVACSLYSKYVPEVVRLLVEAGADANANAYSGGGTPLIQLFITLHHGSCFWKYEIGPGAYKILQLLLDHGADVNKRTETYGTPLYQACFLRQQELISFLIGSGALVYGHYDYYLTGHHYHESQVSNEYILEELRKVRLVDGDPRPTDHMLHTDHSGM